MSTINSKNPRAKKLNGIMRKIAMFVVQETYTDEPEAQKLMSEAIDKLEKAAEILIANDEKEAAK